MSKIISIYGGYCAHDACSVYIEDGKIKSIIQEERPRRVKVYKDQYANPILSLHRIEKEFGVKLKDNLGVFTEGRYLYYWERPAYDIKFGMNYQFVGW
jgi:predicted NodU family carbamoyl transferase